MQSGSARFYYSVCKSSPHPVQLMGLGWTKGKVSPRPGDKEHVWIMKEQGREPSKIELKRMVVGSSVDFSPFGNQLLPTFSAGLKSVGCKSRPRSPPPAPWWCQWWPQWSPAGCCSSEEWRCHEGGASGQWVVLGKDRQTEIRFRETWQPSVYSSLLRMWRVPVVLGMA